MKITAQYNMHQLNSIKKNINNMEAMDQVNEYGDEETDVNRKHMRGKCWRR